MRIITGKYRGRKLETPFGNEIRPTSDKVKESIFNILMCDVEDAVCVDLFAGTGNLGLEALSRGASNAGSVTTRETALILSSVTLNIVRRRMNQLFLLEITRRLSNELMKKLISFFLIHHTMMGSMKKPLNR
ncbi:MAG: RsmD family RNA methyltransferase [[Eubacterium] sulci]|nr:RsmD family RNA methyltransferase [[Eubacterium] sulci]